MDAFGELLDASNTDADDEPPTAVGHAVHRFACQADPWVRHAVDLSPLTAAQVAWLLSLPAAGLARPAVATTAPAASRFDACSASRVTTVTGAPRSLHGRHDYAGEQAAARREKLGMWQGQFVEPWKARQKSSK